MSKKACKQVVTSHGIPAVGNKKHTTINQSVTLKYLQASSL